MDSQRIVTAAVEAFLDGQSGERHAAADEGRRRHRVGAVTLGFVMGIGARALYRRARELDLESVARAVERRMVN